jgi:hypothetical protein
MRLGTVPGSEAEEEAVVGIERAICYSCGRTGYRDGRRGRLLKERWDSTEGRRGIGRGDGHAYRRSGHAR